MIELEAAQAQILAAVPVAAPESVPLAAAHRRILAEAQTAALDLPAFDNSAVDGYAVRAEDTATATTATPVSLQVVGHVPAGESWGRRLMAGECVRLFTGSPLPPGADAVVMQEDTCRLAANAPSVEILEAARPFEHVRLRGVDVRCGELIGAAGEVLTAGRLALLGAAGIGTVRVGRRPRVALLATGSELRTPDEPLHPGQIYESNRTMLAALVEAAGGVPQSLPLVRDTLAETQRALETAFAQHDLVVTSGGVSVGELDFVKTAFAGLGGELGFWRVAMRPGKPFVFGQWNGKFLLGLPGNPVSAFVTFLLLVRPAILHWQGARDWDLPGATGRLVEAMANPGDRRHFVRVYLDGHGEVRPAGLQESHALKSLAQANGLVEIPPHGRLAAGEMVSVLRWD